MGLTNFCALTLPKSYSTSLKRFNTVSVFKLRLGKITSSTLFSFTSSLGCSLEFFSFLFSGFFTSFLVSGFFILGFTSFNFRFFYLLF